MYIYIKQYNGGKPTIMSGFLKSHGESPVVTIGLNTSYIFSPNKNWMIWGYPHFTTPPLLWESHGDYFLVSFCHETWGLTNLKHEK